MEYTKKKNFIATLCFTVLIITTTLLLSACDGINGIIPRDATINDIYIDTSEEISLNIKYTVIPNVDIHDLEITFKYYDKNSQLITTKVEKLGNVKKGIQYTVSVSLFEFGFLDLLKIYSVKANVTNGTV